MTIHPRTFNWSQDARDYPWIFKCDRASCFYSVSARSEMKARIAKFRHGVGANVCPTVNKLYVNGVRVR